MQRLLTTRSCLLYIQQCVPVVLRVCALGIEALIAGLCHTWLICRGESPGGGSDMSDCDGLCKLGRQEGQARANSSPSRQLRALQKPMLRED